MLGEKLVGYNGYYGCFYCNIHGLYVPEKKHVYFPNSQSFVPRVSTDIPALVEKVSCPCITIIIPSCCSCFYIMSV